MQNSKNSNEILKLWGIVNNSIKTMQRPQRLFKIIPKKTALIIIDMQNCFCSVGGSIENPDTRKITPHINKLTKEFRKQKMPVIWIKMIGKPNGSDTGLWKYFQANSPISKDRLSPLIALSEKSKESQLWRDLEVSKSDFKINKNRYSALINNSSSLNKLLKKLNLDTLVITGVGTNVCCESTARDAMMLNYKVIFVSDANATFNKIFHEVSLMNIKLFFGDVATTNDILKELNNK